MKRVVTNGENLKILLILLISYSLERLLKEIINGKTTKLLVSSRNENMRKRSM